MVVEITTPQPLPTATPTPIFDIIMLNYVIPILGLVAGIMVFLIIYKYIIKPRLNSKNTKSLLFEDFNIGKYSILLFRKIGDKYVQIDKKRMNIKDDKFVYNHKDFKTFDIKKPFFSDKKNNYYAFDYDSGDLLTVHTKGMPEKVTIHDVDIYVNRNIIEQLVKGLESPTDKKQWFMLIVGAVLGVGIGIIIGQFIGNSDNAEPTAQLILGVFNLVK
jgi:hypothetical protein